MKKNSSKTNMEKTNKKKPLIITAIIILVLLTFGIITSYKDSSNKEVNKENNGKVILTIKENTLTPKGATFVLKNSTDKQYWYGDAYVIEKKENGKWFEIDTLTGKPLIWNTVVYTLGINEEKEINIDWSSGYGELKTGEYRLVKTTFKEDDRPIDEKLYLYAEFNIN